MDTSMSGLAKAVRVPQSGKYKVIVTASERLEIIVRKGGREGKEGREGTAIDSDGSFSPFSSIPSLPRVPYLLFEVRTKRKNNGIFGTK
jgi:hypothetical protein